MLKNFEQLRLATSPYEGLYEMVVPREHLLRRIKEHIDFSFVNPMLKKQYCEAFERPATEPELMFKLMFLKKLYDLSDIRLISQAQTDMAYKYFLNLDPEAAMIDPSLMTKFRKTRITEDILEEMLKETIRQAMEKGIIKSDTIIVDSTHTNANARLKRPNQVIRDLCKDLRREIYRTMYELSEKFPEKPEETADLESEIAYAQALLDAMEEGIAAGNVRIVKEIHAHIKELLDTDRIREIRSKNDEDAQIGHKSGDQIFFGYKSHIAMTDERLISGIEVTDGGEQDVNHLIAAVEQSRDNGIHVKEIVGDMAYVSQGNLEYCETIGAELIAKTNSAVAASAKPREDGFEYNKDAKTMQCPADELALSIRKQKARNGNCYRIYFFSKSACDQCSRKENCKTGKSKTKSYCITLLSTKNLNRLEFENTGDFNRRLQIRYKIEEKNGEMKVAHGLSRADSTGLEAMRLQTYFTAFVVNVKRIVKLGTQFYPNDSYISCAAAFFSFNADSSRLTA